MKKSKVMLLCIFFFILYSCVPTPEAIPANAELTIHNTTTHNLNIYQSFIKNLNTNEEEKVPTYESLGNYSAGERKTHTVKSGWKLHLYAEGEGYNWEDNLDIPYTEFEKNQSPEQYSIEIIEIIPPPVTSFTLNNTTHTELYDILRPLLDEQNPRPASGVIYHGDQYGHHTSKIIGIKEYHNNINMILIEEAPDMGFILFKDRDVLYPFVTSESTQGNSGTIYWE